MDFSVIFQLRTKKFWWMDVIFYFVISLLVATVLCYVIFLVKNNFQREDIKKETVALQTVGTDQQKEDEKIVIGYQKKISDFVGLLKNHEFASNVFAFMQQQTMPNVWFRQFGLDEKNAGVQLSGESDDMDAFSRQVASFEKNKYVNNIGTLNSSVGDSAKINFSMSLALDQGIFNYISNVSSIVETTTPSGQSPLQQNPIAPAGPGGNPATAIPSTGGQQFSQPSGGAPSSEKLITSFHFLLNPEVAGVVDETKYTITLNVPYGTDVKNLAPSMVISPGAMVMPASGISQDFTNPVTYRVTAEDGSVQTYKVTVIVGAPPKAAIKPQQSGYTLLIVIVLAGLAVVALSVIFLFVWRKIKSKKTNIQK